jgi:hypothetical protein
MPIQLPAENPYCALPAVPGDPPTTADMVAAIVYCGAAFNSHIDRENLVPIVTAVSQDILQVRPISVYQWSRRHLYTERL